MVCCLLMVGDRCSSLVVRCSLFVAGCSLFVVCCVLSVVRFFFFFVRALLSAVCCRMLLGVVCSCVDCRQSCVASCVLCVD